MGLRKNAAGEWTGTDDILTAAIAATMRAMRRKKEESEEQASREGIVDSSMVYEEIRVYIKEAASREGSYMDVDEPARQYLRGTSVMSMGTVLQTIEIKNEFVEEEVAFAIEIDNAVDMRSEGLRSIAEEVEDEDLSLRMEDTSLHPMNEPGLHAQDQPDHELQSSSPFNPSTDPFKDSRKAAGRNKGKHPATFEYTLCPKRVTRAYNLQSHMRTHSDERPFICKVCGEPFERRHDRKKHEKDTHGKHGPQQLFSCTGQLKDGAQWGGGRLFARADELARHFNSDVGRLCMGQLLAEEQKGKCREAQQQREVDINLGLVLQPPTGLTRSPITGIFNVQGVVPARGRPDTQLTISISAATFDIASNFRGLGCIGSFHGRWSKLKWCSKITLCWTAIIIAHYLLKYRICRICQHGPWRFSLWSSSKFTAAAFYFLELQEHFHLRA